MAILYVLDTNIVWYLFYTEKMYLKSLPQVLVYHTRDLKNSLENIELQSYTDDARYKWREASRNEGMASKEGERKNSHTVLHAYMF